MIAFMSLSMPSVRGVITADEKIVKRHLGFFVVTVSNINRLSK